MMHFAYDGFTHEGDVRCFLFRGIEGHDLVSFAIEVELTLFASNHIPVQQGPEFCLSLLNTALLANAVDLNRFQNYRVVREDFQPLLMERERKAAQKAKKKRFRQPPRRPSAASNVRLNTVPGTI